MGKHFSYMPTYSFHLCTPVTSRTIKGCRSEFPNVAAALIEANRLGWNMIRKHARGKPCQLRSRLDVRDEGDAPVARVLLAELAHQMT